METKKPLQVTILNRNNQTRERIETNAIIIASIKDDGNPVVRLFAEHASGVDRFCLYAAIKRYSEKMEADNPQFKTLYQEIEAEGGFINKRREWERTEIEESKGESSEVEGEPYDDPDPDAHTHDYDEYGECKICGAIKYKSCLWFELYGGEP